MFERYTENLRRVIFFARYEASTQGSDSIEVDHLLLGLLREEKALFDGLLRDGGWERAQLVEYLQALRVPEGSASTSTDLPLSRTVKHILKFATEEADRFHHEDIHSTHLLQGIVRESSPTAKALEQHGLDLEKLRSILASSQPNNPEQHGGSASALFTLQQQFGALTGRLSRETEPALLYRLDRPANSR